MQPKPNNYTNADKTELRTVCKYHKYRQNRITNCVKVSLIQLKPIYEVCASITNAAKSELRTVWKYHKCSQNRTTNCMQVSQMRTKPNYELYASITDAAKTELRTVCKYHKCSQNRTTNFMQVSQMQPKPNFELYASITDAAKTELRTVCKYHRCGQIRTTNCMQVSQMGPKPNYELYSSITNVAKSDLRNVCKRVCDASFIKYKQTQGHTDASVSNKKCSEVSHFNTIRLHWWSKCHKHCQNQLTYLYKYHQCNQNQDLNCRIVSVTKSRRALQVWPLFKLCANVTG